MRSSPVTNVAIVTRDAVSRHTPGLYRSGVPVAQQRWQAAVAYRRVGEQVHRGAPWLPSVARLAMQPLVEFLLLVQALLIGQRKLVQLLPRHVAPPLRCGKPADL